MNIFEILSLRYQFNELVSSIRMPKHRKDGTIENLKFFTKQKQKQKYKKANEIALRILEASNEPYKRVRFKS